MAGLVAKSLIAMTALITITLVIERVSLEWYFVR